MDHCKISILNVPFIVFFESQCHGVTKDAYLFKICDPFAKNPITNVTDNGVELTSEIDKNPPVTDLQNLKVDPSSANLSRNWWEL